MIDNDYLYPPPSFGNISWIYPWTGLINDTFKLFLNSFFHTVIGHYILNEQTTNKRLEKHFSKGKTIFVNSGRSAILLALLGIGIKKGDEVILSDFNCATVIDPIIKSGASPILVDCDKNGKINIFEVKRAITNKTKAIILSNIYGLLDERKNILSIIDGRDITLIDDLSQSLILPKNNPEYFDKRCIFIFSFGQEKHVYCFGGGAVWKDDKTFIRKIKIMKKFTTPTDFNLLKTALMRIKYFITLIIYAKAKKFVNILEKFNLVLKLNKIKITEEPKVPEDIKIQLMNPIQKKILVNKLEHYEKIRKYNLSNYNNLKKTLAKNNSWEVIEGNKINPLYFTIITKKSRYIISKYLASESIPTVWNYIPLHLFERYKKYSRGLFKNADNLWTRVLSLPFRYPMTNQQLKYVISRLNLIDQKS